MQNSSALIKATTEAVSRGYQVIPLNPLAKNPRISSWPHFRWPDSPSRDTVVEQLEKWSENTDEQINLGIVLGDTSHRLVDVDLDHYRTARLKEFFLPPTAAKSGRPGKPNSHYWYICEEGTLPGTRQHLMPRTLQPDGTMKKGPVIVELRANGAQTMFPPSIWKDKASNRTEQTAWTGEPWGGKTGPTVVNGRRLAVQVALLALSSVLLDSWPTSGSRHEAYLALAGGLLRAGDGIVHPWWEQNAAVLIRALADATLDDDGADARETESIQPTVRALQNGKPVTGFGKLAELLGDEQVKQVRLLVGEVESAAGVTSRQAPSVTAVDVDDAIATRDAEIGSLSPEERDPLDERVGSWEPVDLEPYLSGQVSPVLPELLMRDDGQALLYPGRVNMLYGSSESAKSWIALNCGLQEMAQGNRVMYIDFEDEPVNTLDRLKRMGAGADDLRFLFSYVRPEDPIEAMQRDRWGNTHHTPQGTANQDIFTKAVETVDPRLIIADGMTVLYGLHGLDSNDAVSTDIITGWLKKMTRNGNTTVIVIDHTGKGSERGTTPIGAHHKQAMVQGAMIQVWPVRQPMPDAVGQVELIVIKDRPGQVRKISVKSGNKAQLAAVVTIDSTVKDITTMTISAPPDPNSPNQQAKKAAETKKHQMYKAEENAVRALYQDEVGKGLPLSAIFQAMGMEREDSDSSGKLGDWKDQDQVKRWAECVKRLMDQGWLYAAGNTKARRYVLALSENDPNGMDVDLTGQPDDD